MEKMKKHLGNFEEWFNNKFGWFFTNGMKQVEDNRGA